MRLVEIYSAEENNWIADKIKELGYGNDDFWTGGKYSVPWPQFKWNDANKIEFVNWADGEPAKGNEERYNTVHYIALTAATDFKWSNVVDDYFNDVKNYFVCKEIVKVNSDPLPYNTFKFTGKKYQFNTAAKMSAFDASSYCYGKRMTLAAIVSKEENDWIVNKIKELGFGSDDFWTGGFLHQSYPRNFNWDTYSDDVTFTDWADGQPRKVDDRLLNCMVLTASVDFKWSLRLCQFDLNYVVCKERFPDSGLAPTLL
ncbi:hypothetical protein HA402_012920 [Bradysia odoriphaga]|nr:hypothetical protein HA402_012920 [Bradysia odoriphaga]